jgi:TatD DNase family protein
MQLIDTHTHIYLPEFDADRDEVVHRALSSGVSTLLMPNIDFSSIDPMIAAMHRYPGTCRPMLGLHPTSVKNNFREELEKILALWPAYDFVAVGEIGIDLYWDKTHIEQQIEAMHMQCNFALEKEVPVVVHSRDSFPEVFSVLGEYKGKGLKGVLHAFTGGMAEARKAIEMGFALGIGGISTFKNSGLAEVIKSVGPGNIVLETDSPYLAPVPYRGKRNESSYICIVNRKIAELCGMSEENVASVTTENAKIVFNI